MSVSSSTSLPAGISVVVPVYNSAAIARMHFRSMDRPAYVLRSWTDNKI